METVKFGIIGCGLMGREFASAAMRWAHLPEMDVKPEIIAICDTNLTPKMESWYRDGLGTITQATADYSEVAANPEVEAVYCAVPHHLHEEIFIAFIQAGKHLMGEKPFGIDKKANDNIMKAIKENPGVFVRCSSEFPFTPAMQRLCRMIEEDVFGDIIEVESGFLHSSDLNTEKPINWKRMIRYNGEYGVMGDLGMHPTHVPFRAGWIPLNVRAFLSNLVKERPGEDGCGEECETWDNATMFCEARHPGGDTFPMTIKTQQIAPGEKNTWYLTVRWMKCSAKFSTKNINRIEILEYDGGEQAWQQIDMGHETTFKSVTGGISL